MDYSRHIIIVGPMKTGSTSLWHWLCQSPDMATPRAKEIQYYGQQRRGPNEAAYDEMTGCELGKWTIDATPWYFTKPAVAMQIAREAPWAHIICLYRTPEERTLSHYWHNRRMKREPRTLADALAWELDLIRRGILLPGIAGIIAHSLYRLWLPTLWPGATVLTLSALKPQAAVDRVCDAAGLPRYELRDAESRMVSPGTQTYSQADLALAAAVIDDAYAALPYTA